MKSVLILGNGISRTQPEHVEFIKNWKGEIWGCNRIYLDLGHRLSRLAGHVDVMREALEYRQSTGCSFEIWGGHLGGVREYTKVFTCPVLFRKDSGTTLVAQALEEGYEKICCCGFDLGGPEIYSKVHHQHNKKNWVLRWRALADYYGLDSVEFVGYDHKGFILSSANENSYMKRYRRGLPHIPDPNYWEIFSKKTGWKPGMEVPEVVEVEYLKGPRIGWKTKYNADVATILADRGEIKIVKTEPEEPENGKKRGRPSKKTEQQPAEEPEKEEVEA